MNTYRVVFPLEVLLQGDNGRQAERLFRQLIRDGNLQFEVEPAPSSITEQAGRDLYNLSYHVEW